MAGHSTTDALADDGKTKILIRLRRLEGQVRGLQRMIAEDRDCRDILTLYAGIRSALDASADLVLERYLRECQADPHAERADAARIVQAVKLARG